MIFNDEYLFIIYDFNLFKLADIEMQHIAEYES